MLLSWLGGLALFFLRPDPLWLGLAFLVAGAFTLLSAAHMTALAVRLAAALRTVRVVRPDGTLLSPSRSVPRGRFLGLAFKAGVAMLVGSLLGLRTQQPSPSGTAQARACRGKHDTANEPGAKQVENVCSDKGVAREVCDQIVLLKGILFAHSFCSQFDCPKGAVCFAVFDEGQGSSEDLGGGCFQCERTVFLVECACGPRPDGIQSAEHMRTVLAQEVNRQIQEQRNRL